MNPIVLALDEPTNSLDASGRAALARTLSGLDCAQLIATHDLAFASAVCSRALVLFGGTLVADTPLSSLLSDRETLERYGLAARVGGAHEQAIVF
jgi:ATPase subunit of ABC transporter with duplicated ATPase domains